MIAKSILLRAFLAFLVSLVLLLFVLFKIDPERAGIPEFAFFYLVLFSLFWSTFFILGIIARKYILKRRNDEVVFFNTVLESALLSILFTVLILLHQLDQFNVLNIIISIFVIGALEFAFSKEDNHE